MSITGRVPRRCIGLSMLFMAAAAASGLLQATELPARPALATANAYATEAGAEVLRAGGNAFDAAVAVSAVLGLVEPESSGLGGGGFFLLRIAAEDREVFVDAREVAPAEATPDMFVDADGVAVRERAVNGPLAAAIPGLPAGLAHLAGHYGRLPLGDTLAPAIRLAEDGWRFGPKNAAMLRFREDVLAKDPAASALFLPDGGNPPVGTLMRNPDYAQTLRVLVDAGADGFYRGAFAQRLVDGMRAAGGIWTTADLAGYRVVERNPLRVHHRGYDIVTAPLPSSGGIALAQMFQILDGYDFGTLGRVDRVHLLVEAMRRAYRDRAVHLGDPDFVEVPVARLSSPDYAAGLRAGIHPRRATPSGLLPGVGGTVQGDDTTHFSIVDAEGNLVAATLTVNLPYGNGQVIDGTGFLLNNEMDDFSIKPGVPNAFGLVGDDANAIAPGKRPLSSMTPSFLFGPGRVAVIGTPGGSRIITMVALGLIGLIEGGSAQAVVAEPRIHHQYLPDELSVEDGALGPEELSALRDRGHEVGVRDRGWGNMQLVVWDRGTGEVDAASDPRWEGVGRGIAVEPADAEAVFR